MTVSLEQQIRTYHATNPPGWCWLEKMFALAESVLTSRANFVVELGVFGGRSLIPLAMALAAQGHGFAWGIDPWRKEASLEALDPVADAAHIQWWSTVDLDAVHTRAAADIWHFSLSCGLLRTSSAIAAKLFRPASIDLLHIDGCHVEPVACRDVETWLPLCKQDAMIWFDDTNWASTQRAVKLLEASCEQLLVLPDAATGSETRLYRKR